mgnify:CR=1 FL=1
MEKPGKKLKKFFIIIGTTGMVYAGLKYLLPLVVPLLLGYTLALLLRPSARFLQHRIIICVFGKKWKPSLGLLGTVQLLILGVLGSFMLAMGVRRLWEETSTLMDQLPVWLDGLYFWIEEKCFGLEKRFGFDPGWGIRVARSMNKICEGKNSAIFDDGLLLYSWSYRSYWIYKFIYFLQCYFKFTGNGRAERTAGPVCF